MEARIASYLTNDAAVGTGPGRCGAIFSKSARPRARYAPAEVALGRAVALAAGDKDNDALGDVGTEERLLAIEGIELSPKPAAKAAAKTSTKPVRSGGLDLDVAAALRHLRRVDPKLARWIDRIGTFSIELQKTDSSFAALAEAIVYQQLHGKAAATIFGRFRALYPGRRFPRPEEVLATPEATLRQVGLSRNKMLAIRDLAEKVQSGVVPTVPALRRMSNEEIIARLTAVRGIGRWTAEMLLIFRLGRPDVLPVDDFGVRKGWSVVLRKKEMPSPAELARYGERWQPYRTVASWYLWRAADLGKSAT